MKTRSNQGLLPFRLEGKWLKNKCYKQKQHLITTSHTYSAVTTTTSNGDYGLAHVNV